MDTSSKEVVSDFFPVAPYKMLIGLMTEHIHPRNQTILVIDLITGTDGLLCFFTIENSLKKRDIKVVPGKAFFHMAHVLSF
jgi:hypothetical protein